MPRRNVWITEEVDKLIKELEINISGFINEEIPLRFNPTGHIRNEIRKHENRVKELKEKFKKLLRKYGDNENLNQNDEV